MADKSVYEILSAVDCKGMTEEKNGLTYLSWTYAWNEVKKRFPDATYTIFHGENHKPFYEDECYGIMCFTKVTINGETLEMWLPVMDGANNAMRSQPYTIQTKYKSIEVKAATMFDINKTIMRCLVKNLAMFGLGINIYSGDDLPLGADEDTPAPVKTPAKEVTLDDVRKEVDQCNTLAELQAIKAKYPKFATNAQFSNMLNDRYQKIK